MYTSMAQGRLTLVAKIRMNVQTKTRRLQKKHLFIARLQWIYRLSLCLHNSVCHLRT